MSGTVPPKTTVTMTDMKSKELFGGVVPPTSTATPTVRKQEEFLAGAVPPPSTATQTGRKKMRLLWGTVPSVSTATPKTETRKSKTECSNGIRNQKLLKLNCKGRLTVRKCFSFNLRSHRRGGAFRNQPRNSITKKGFGNAENLGTNKCFKK